jgi:hypothetical protein
VSFASRIIAVREAVEDGDDGLALEILSALERDVAPVRLDYACACGLRFEWPGLRDRHLDAGVCPATARKAA